MTDSRNVPAASSPAGGSLAAAAAPGRLRQEGRAAPRRRRRRPRAAAAAAGRRAASRAAEDRVRLRRPGRRRRLDLRARQRPQGDREGIRRQGRDQLRRERARGGRRRARVPRHGRPGQQADLRHHLRLHGADAQGRRRHARTSSSSTPPATRRADNMRTYDTPHLRRRLHGRRDRRRHDQDQHARRGRLGPDPRGDPQHQQLHAGRAVGQPEDQDQGRLGQRVVQPAEGNRGRAVADQRRRRRADAEHRLVGGAADGREGRQVRLRLGQRHDRLRPEGAPRARPSSTGRRTTSRPTQDALDGTWKGDRPAPGGA